MDNSLNPDKFIDSIDVSDWEVETDTGWEDITHIHKTVKYYIWEIKTKDFSLKCADEHIVMSSDYKQVFVKDLKINDSILTKKGIQQITSIELSEEEEHMYDITVGSENHTLYTNGILSHNSTVATIFILHSILFSEEPMTAAIIANKEKTAHEILKRVKLAYQELPLWLQQGIAEKQGGWNKGSIGLENGVVLMAASTASSAIRGLSIKLLFLDEFAHVPDNIADDFLSSVYPTIVSGKTSKIIIVSTPLGLNHFYNIWKKAVRGENNFMPIKVHWSEVPGFTEEWKQLTIQDIGPQKFAQEFNNQFLGSTNTLIDASLLERMEIQDPVDLKYGSYLNIYEQPKPNTMYILGVDSAKGTGKDYSVIQVLKISDEHDIEQVALYRNNVIEARDYAQIIIEVSKYYNEAYIMLENNDVGDTVGSTIWYEYEYDRILNCDKKGIGIRSTKKSKLAANILLKRYMENGWLDIKDRSTLYELSRYEEIKPNVFQAPRGQHDDCVTSLLWGIYFLTTVFFDGKNINVKKIDEKFLIDRIEQEDTTGTVAIIDDGDDSSGYDTEGYSPGDDSGWGYDEGMDSGYSPGY
jgi:hypothetical protein